MISPAFTSTYGMLDVEKGRVKLASHLKKVGPVDVVIRATLTEPFGSNDGTSIEFNMTVHSVEPASVGTHPEGRDGEAGSVRSMGDAVRKAQTPNLPPNPPHPQTKERDCDR